MDHNDGGCVVMMRMIMMMMKKMMMMNKNLCTYRATKDNRHTHTQFNNFSS